MVKLTDMRNVFIWVFTLISTLTFGQSKEDHLEPTECYFDTRDLDYYSFIYKHLIKDLSYDPVARMLVLPSFSAENVVSIEGVDRDNREYRKFKVIYKTCKKSIYYEKRRNLTKVITYENEIDSASVRLVRQIFKLILSDTKYNKNDLSGLDGETYIFSGFFLGFGTQTGQIWSPRGGTKMSALVELGNCLIQIAKSYDNVDRKKYKIDLKIKGENLLTKLTQD